MFGFQLRIIWKWGSKWVSVKYHLFTWIGCGAERLEVWISNFASRNFSETDYRYLIWFPENFFNEFEGLSKFPFSFRIPDHNSHFVLESKLRLSWLFEQCSFQLYKERCTFNCILGLSHYHEFFYFGKSLRLLIWSTA